MEFIDLSTLPCELQAMIIGVYPSHKHNLQLISRGIMNSSKAQYLENAHSIQPGLKELSRSIAVNGDDTVICGFGRDQETIGSHDEDEAYMRWDFGTVMFGMLPDLTCHEVHMYGVKLTEDAMTFGRHHVVDISGDGNERHRPLETGLYYRYDLITLYNIMIARTSCMLIDPEYAKKYILRAFESVHSLYVDTQTPKTTPSDRSYALHQATIYCIYLGCNAKMMGIVYDDTKLSYSIEGLHTCTCTRKGVIAFAKAIDALIDQYYHFVLDYITNI